MKAAEETRVHKKMISNEDTNQTKTFRHSRWSVTSENGSSVPYQDLYDAKQKIYDLIKQRYDLWKEWEKNMNTILEMERHTMNASYRRGLYCEGKSGMDKEGAEIIHDLRKNVRQIHKKIKKSYTMTDSIANLEDELLAVINEDDFISWILENLEAQLSSSMDMLADALASHEADRQRIKELSEYCRLAEKALERILSGPKASPTESLLKRKSSRANVKKKSSSVLPYKSSVKFISNLENDMSTLKLKDDLYEIRDKLKRRKIQERVLQEKVHELLGQITAIDTDAALIHGLVTKLIPERRRIQDHKWLGRVIPLTVTAHETAIRLDQFHGNCKEVKERLKHVEHELIHVLSEWEEISENTSNKESDEQLALTAPKKENETDLLKYFRSVWAILRPKIQMLTDHATAIQEEVKISEWKLIEYTQKEITLEKKIEMLEVKLIEKGRRSVPTMKQRLKENLSRFKFLKEDSALENQYILNLENDIKAFRAETLIMESLKCRNDTQIQRDNVKHIMKTSVKESYWFCFFNERRPPRRRDSKTKRRGGHECKDCKTHST